MTLGCNETTTLMSVLWCNSCGVNSTHQCHYTIALANSKFDNLSDADIDSLIDNAIPKNTKKATDWGVSVLIGKIANFKFSKSSKTPWNGKSWEVRGANKRVFPGKDMDIFWNHTKQSFGVCLQITCVVTKDPGNHCFMNCNSMVLDWDLRFFHKTNPRTHQNYLLQNHWHTENTEIRPLYQVVAHRRG